MLKTEIKALRATKKFLRVEFTVVGQAVAHRHVVRIPWAMVADHYEMLVNGAEHEFLRRLGTNRGQYSLPIED